MGVDFGGWGDTENWSNSSPGSQPGQNVPTVTSAGSVNPAPNWMNWLNFGLDALSAYANYTSQRDTNKKNLQNSREQRAWEEMMSNTAVQRHANDIEKAGGNRALAFVNGQQATTPVVSAPQFEAPKFDAPKLNSAFLIQNAMAKASILEAGSRTWVNNEQAQLIQSQRDETDTRAALNKVTARKSEQEIQNLQRTWNEIDARIKNEVTQYELNKIKLYVAQKTKEEAVDSIRSDAILKDLHIDPAGLKSDWARIKRDLLGILNTQDSSGD